MKSVRSTLLWASVVAAAACFLVFFVETSEAAKKDSGASLDNKVQQLIDLSSKRTVIRLNGNKFKYAHSVIMIKI